MLKGIEISRDQEEIKHFKEAIRMGGNVIISMATVFIALFWVVKVSFGNHVYATIAGVIGSMFMMIVESLLYIIRISKIDSKMSKFKHHEHSGKLSPFDLSFSKDHKKKKIIT